MKKSKTELRRETWNVKRKSKLKGEKVREEKKERKKWKKERWRRSSRRRDGVVKTDRQKGNHKAWNKRQSHRKLYLFFLPNYSCVFFASGFFFVLLLFFFNILDIFRVNFWILCLSVSLPLVLAFLTSLTYLTSSPRSVVRTVPPHLPYPLSFLKSSQSIQTNVGVSQFILKNVSVLSYPCPPKFKLFAVFIFRPFFRISFIHSFSSSLIPYLLAMNMYPGRNGCRMRLHRYICQRVPANLPILFFFLCIHLDHGPCHHQRTLIGDTLVIMGV